MILAAVDDLLFSSKIRTTAKQAGVELTFARTPPEILDRARALHPALLIFDLNSAKANPIDTIAELKTQTLLSPDRFLDLLIQKIGYSSYLKEQIRNELKKAGDPVTQITVLQGAIRDL